MITPRFSLSQEETSVTIIIRAPYCNLQELTVSIEDNVFIFYCQPYYLRLHLPGKIEENDNSQGKFDADTGYFTFTYEKISHGEHFHDLEFVTKLLCPKVEIESGNRKIEILNSVDVEGQETNVDNEIEYGFALRGGYKFDMVNGEFRDIFEIDPYRVQFKDRQQLRHEIEKKRFNSDHYLADLLDNEAFTELLYLKLPQRVTSQFTTNELDFLKDLTHIEYNLNEKQINYCLNSLIEILYAYCYDFRTTCFESTCESGWTIAKLSSSLCCFDSFSSAKEAIVCSFRRSLIYPLYRNFNLSQKVFSDLKEFLNFGELWVIKCLIEIYNIFLKGDCGRYILNSLFIKDYILYVMKWDKEEWKKKVAEVNLLKIEKKDLGLNLIQIEQSAESDSLRDAMEKLNLTEGSETDSDDTEDGSSTESESNDE